MARFWNEPSPTTSAHPRRRIVGDEEVAPIRSSLRELFLVSALTFSMFFFKKIRLYNWDVIRERPTFQVRWRLSASEGAAWEGVVCGGREIDLAISLWTLRAAGVG